MWTTTIHNWSIFHVCPCVRWLFAVRSHIQARELSIFVCGQTPTMALMTTVTTNQCRSPCVGQNACRRRMERWADQGSHLLRKIWNIFSLHAIEEHRTEHKRHNIRYTNVGAVVTHETSSRLVRCLFHLILLLNFFSAWTIVDLWCVWNTRIYDSVWRNNERSLFDCLARGEEKQVCQRNPYVIF